MAWSTLRMKCPHCGSYAGHEVVETDPKHYRWNDEATAFFKKHFSEDISYRRRTKECKRCGKRFYSVELPNSFIAKMISHLLNQSVTLTEYEFRLKKEEAEKEELLKRVKAIRKLAVLPKA